MAITDLLLTNQGTSTSTGAINNTSDPVTFSVASGDGCSAGMAISSAIASGVASCA